MGATLAPPAAGIAAQLRQMIAVLEAERQALAALDADGVIASSSEKESLCGALAGYGPDALDGETRALAETAHQLNEVNRRVRTLLAANVAARLEALGGGRHRLGRSRYPAFAATRG